MKHGKTLKELAQEIERQQASKRDFIVPSAAMQMRVVENQLVLAMPTNSGSEMFGVGDTFHSQMSQHVGIRADYYERMKLQAPELLCQNVNTWLGKSGESRMIRTLDNKARALVSSKFKPMDNYDLVKNVLPLVAQYDLRVESCEVTEKRLHLKLVSPGIMKKIKTAGVGDTIHFGLALRNSEIGLGLLGIDGLLWTLRCRNGAIGENIATKYHVGQRQASGDASWEIFTDETKRLSDKAFWAQIKDAVKATLENAKERFDGWIKRVEKTTEILLPSPTVAVEIAKEKYALSDAEGEGILHHLAIGGDLSLYGLFNAVTAFAQDKALTYERATELEVVGGKMIEAAESILA